MDTRRWMAVGATLSLFLGAGCASPPGPLNPGAAEFNTGATVARSPDGFEHGPLHLSEEGRAEAEARLDEAWDAHRAAPGDERVLIWVGRRLAYLGRYEDAIALYTEGLERHKGSPRLLRHRGHRHITLFQFEQAVEDLRRAAALSAGTEDEVEPDGQPNAAGIPRGTLRSNIWYHLGLAFFLRGDLDHARHAYERCLHHSHNDDMIVATSHWLYMTLRRMGDDRDAETLLADVHEDMDILENHAYHELLLMYAGRRTPEEVLAGLDPSSVKFATRAYGVANWHRAEGRIDQARALLDEIRAADGWPAFGAIAAETDLARHDL